MKILALADTESPMLWDFYKPKYLEDIDLILSAGDLDPDYLSFLVTMGHAPVLYVPGNHDTAYLTHPPAGCINIDRKIYRHENVRILGLGGSMKYNNGPNQYTEAEMRSTVRRMTFSVAWNRGFDILLTHSPAAGFHDCDDLPHRGFEVFNRLIDTHHPVYHIHGHIHRSYVNSFARAEQRNRTTVINAFEKYILDI